MAVIHFITTILYNVLRYVTIFMIAHIIVNARL